MTPEALFQAGRLNEAIKALSAELRDRPTDVHRRTFLFELLCFAGEYDRAEKHLNILAEGSTDTQIGSAVYFSALQAERTRLEHFRDGGSSAPPARASSGTLNGTPFTSIADADPRIGSRLEIFAGGTYIWLRFEHIASIEIQPPKRLRDLLWIQALVRTSPEFQEHQPGQVLIPVLYPFSFASENDAVRLGRETHWQERGEQEPVPVGQKMFLVDGEEFPLLEMRTLEFTATDGASAS